MSFASVVVHVSCEDTAEPLALTDRVLAICQQCLNVRLDLRRLVDVEVRRRRRFTIVMPCKCMEDDWELRRGQLRRAKERVDDVRVATNSQLIIIEFLVRIVEDSLVRPIIL